MSNFKTAIAAENEIMKAVDVTFGYDSSIDNVAVALKAVLSGADSDYVIGGKVKQYGAGGMNVAIEPIFAFCNNTEVCVAETVQTEPVSFEEADNELDRIDIVEVCGTPEGYDQQQRKFNNPSTGTKTTKTVNTKKRIKLTVVVKKGSNGSESAPVVDSGYVKLAEVRIPAGTNNITNEMIKNITSRKAGIANTEWTTNVSATFNPPFLTDTFYTYLIAHNENGSHKDGAIKAAHISFGTDGDKVKGSIIPTGQSKTINGVDFSSLDSITALIDALADNVNALYPYANNILSRFDFITDLPVAASTENIDITTGGEMTIDGVSVTVGQLVFLKNQTDAKENGFYEVQSGAWNRYAGYSILNADVFTHKFVFIKAGIVNKGKIFYLDGDRYTVGTSKLNFTESNLTPYIKANSFMMRDENGRAKVAAPVAEDDIAIKANVTKEVTERINYNKMITSHFDSCDGRNLLTVLGVSTIEQAFEVLSTRCNGTGVPDFSGLMIGDYLDLPSLTVGGTTYTWNESYKNLRIVISGFNHYKGVGDTENTKNHILWTFRNIVLQRIINPTKMVYKYDEHGNWLHGPTINYVPIPTGYNNSNMNSFLNGAFTAGINAAIGNKLYTVRRVADNDENTRTWSSFTTFLPTEVEIFGTPTYGNDQKKYNINIQFPIFRNSSFYRVKRYNGSRLWWWTATPHQQHSNTYTHFCNVDNKGNIYFTSISNGSGGVAPAFCTC